MDNAASPHGPTPFYFGVSPKRLYGFHHPPSTSHGKSSAIVICAPIGQEYIQAHRVLYQLAILLTKAGFHVLRFDYFGCGDSEGDLDQGSLELWTKDIHMAVDEIRNRSKLTRVSLIGLRIGANLALRAAVDSPHVDGIMLWQPISDGGLYLEELIEAHQNDYLKEKSQKKEPLDPSAMETMKEILGFPMTSELRRELERISLDAVKLRPDINMLVLCNDEKSKYVRGLGRFLENHPHANFHVIEDQIEVWKESNKRLTPFSSIQYLSKWADTVQS